MGLDKQINEALTLGRARRQADAWPTHRAKATKRHARITHARRVARRLSIPVGVLWN